MEYRRIRNVYKIGKRKSLKKLQILFGGFKYCCYLCIVIKKKTTICTNQMRITD